MNGAKITANNNISKARQLLLTQASSKTADIRNSTGRDQMDEETQRIAKQRIETLFKLAKTTINENPTLATEYVQTARKIAMSARVSLPTEYRRQVCKHCKSFILPGINCKVRLQQKREPHAVITCLKCGGKTRIPLKQKTWKTIT